MISILTNYILFIERILMHYEAELTFLCRLFKNLHTKTILLDANSNDFPVLDLGLREMIYGKTDYKKLFFAIPNIHKPNTIFLMQDAFLCRYACFPLPDTENSPSYLLIGPYTNHYITKSILLNIAERHALSPQQYNQLNKYYSNLPVIPEEDSLRILFSTLGETLWDSMENFSIEYMDNLMPENIEPLASRPDFREPEEAFLTMQVLEKRYASENLLIHAVSQGLTHKAEAAIARNSFRLMEQRLADPVRDIKNYCIILNTILRKGAEYGDVHPLHIDSLSSRFARKIEQIVSPESGLTLQKEMVHKYCLLVKNHSTKGYSLPIQKVLARIDSDLTADLSLKTQAQLLNVNASYLSTLFKKETGVTLTDYVNKKRVENAVFLLNSTNMQIQGIAQFCGIQDVNYFTKIFKKYIGKTPKEYRGEIS